MGLRECQLPDELNGDISVKVGRTEVFTDKEGYLWGTGIPAGCRHCLQQRFGAVILTSTETVIDPAEHPEIDCSNNEYSDGFHTTGMKRGDNTKRFVWDEAGRTPMGADDADGIVTYSALTRIVCIRDGDID